MADVRRRLKAAEQKIDHLEREMNWVKAMLAVQSGPTRPAPAPPPDEEDYRDDPH